MRTRESKQEAKLGKQREKLDEVSKDGVDKLVRRVNGRSDRAKRNGKRVVEEKEEDSRITWNDVDENQNGRDVSINEMGTQSFDFSKRNDADDDGIDWEDGGGGDSGGDGGGGGGLTIEFLSESSDSVKKKPVRRATAQEKELAELVHKVHLLCLLARGRIVDRACDDPLIQASLLSLLPAHLMEISRASKLSASALSPIVRWFHNNFHIRSSVSKKKRFQSALAYALATHEGTPEEIAALSVALFRALNITTRFVSILDVVSIKPDTDKCESSTQDTSREHRGVFSTSTLMVDKPKEVSVSTVKSFSCNEKNSVCETSMEFSCISKDQNTRSSKTHNEGPLGAAESESRTTDSELCSSSKSQGSKRKGDLEFEMQLQMALSATAIASHQESMKTDARSLIGDSSNISSPPKKIRTVGSEESPSTAIGSRKIGSPLYWAEVYCSGENLTGKWVHVDAINAIIDGEQKVEAAAAACKTSLRYVVAFAGHGAKDVTRRYCMKWYKIASHRINSIWWDAVLAPLRELESQATVGSSGGTEVSEEKIDVGTSRRNSLVATRTLLEDMELETRALTEPLPTNQQAYKNHQLYAIERWLTKHQILRPKGPILGFCSGHPVYPRACVQTLKTKHRWLREGLQVKANEFPAKVLEQSVKVKKIFLEDDDYGEVDSRGNIELYGKWQLEPLQLPHAVNGIVPKNDRGQVDVWSEKCLPLGTVHLRLPRVFHIAKRLEIDYAPAMVGFEFKNGRSVPVYEGIVVCREFKDAILEAYAEEEEMREAEEKKRSEVQALSRWYQLLSSIVTRQRLNNCYGKGSSMQTSSCVQDKNSKPEIHVRDEPKKQSHGRKKRDRQKLMDAPSVIPTEDHEHEHVFLAEDESFDEESSVRTKRCRCGFSIEVEEL